MFIHFQIFDCRPTSNHRNTTRTPPRLQTEASAAPHRNLRGSTRTPPQFNTDSSTVQHGLLRGSTQKPPRLHTDSSTAPHRWGDARRASTVVSPTLFVGDESVGDLSLPYKLDLGEVAPTAMYQPISEFNLSEVEGGTSGFIPHAFVSDEQRGANQSVCPPGTFYPFLHSLGAFSLYVH